MNITQGLARVRDQLDDVSKLKYSDAEIIRAFDEAARSLTRAQMFSSKEWSNFSFMLKSADARTLFQNTYEWKLPTWVEVVRKVYKRDSTPTSGEVTFSPYDWTEAPNLLGIAIPKTDPSRRSGWSWEGNHTLRLWNWTMIPEIAIECVATAAPMFRVTVTNIPGTPTPSAFFFPSSAGANDLGEFGFIEEGRYVNSDVMVSGTTGANDLKLGQVRRVVYSSSAALDVATRRTRFDLDVALASNVAVGDTFESMLPVQPIHARLLILKVVNACAVKKFNIDLQKSIAGELQEEMNAFVAWATKPRDTNGPFFKMSGFLSRRPYDPDKRQYGYAQGIWS